MDSEDDLERLRLLLLGSNRDHIDQLRARIENPETRAEDLAEVLADASAIANQANSDKLATALQAPVSTALRRSIEQQPESVADALFPVIMPAIRRAIAEALREFTERVDTLLNQQLSMKGLRWRVEALRSGVPFREIVLRETLQFQVQQVLLIKNDSGLLIQHLQQPGLSSTADSDAVSGMLWAIESFVRDSFTGDADGGLNRVTMEDHIVYLKHGPEATLACVVRGVATDNFSEHLERVVGQIHGLYHRQLLAYDGDKEALQDAEPLLRTCFRSELRNKDEFESAPTSSLKKNILLFGLIAVLGWLGWTAYQLHSERKTIDALVQSLDSEAGIVMLGAKKQNQQWTLKGLRDPDSTDPVTLLQQTALEPESVSLELTPYVSLEPALQLQRIRKDWAIPESVSLSIDEGHLHLAGTAPLEWVQMHRFRSDLPLGIGKLNSDKLRPSQKSMAEFIRETLVLTAETAIEFNNGQATIMAPLDQKHRDEVRAINATLDGFSHVSVERWIDPDAEKITDLMQTLQGTTFQFTEDTTLASHSRQTLDTTIPALKSLHQLLKSKQQKLSMTIIGYNSPEGSEEENHRLRQQRAEFIANTFQQAGVLSPGARVTGSKMLPQSVNKAGAGSRRAVLQLEITP